MSGTEIEGNHPAHRLTSRVEVVSVGSRISDNLAQQPRDDIHFLRSLPIVIDSNLREMRHEYDAGVFCLELWFRPDTSPQAKAKWQSGIWPDCAGIPHEHDQRQVGWRVQWDKEIVFQNASRLFVFVFQMVETVKSFLGDILC